MKLLIISNMAHYKKNEQIVGWGPTVEEINHLSGLFSEVRHIACLYSDPAPASALPYQVENVQMVFVHPAGGQFLIDKIKILRLLSVYVRTILRELADVDAVHVRAPANISLIAIILLAFLKFPKKRWIKYAGNWQPDKPGAWSYAFQRWLLLKNFSRALVTVNGDWPNQPSHIRSFYNPCLTDEEIQKARIFAKQKLFSEPLQIIFAGRVESAKGFDTVIEIMQILRQEKVPVMLDIAGDGPQRIYYENVIFELGLQDVIRFRGWIPRTLMGNLYSKAHIILLPSLSEGWPKVLSEAMAYGVLPIASDVSSIGQYLRKFELGRVCPPNDPKGFAEAIEYYVSHRDIWIKETERGLSVVSNFTYGTYLVAVRELLKLSFT